MLELDWDIVWTIVNLLILFLLLKHFLFKPITQMMESRTAEIENNLKDAEEQKQKAQQLNTQYEEQLQGAQAQAAQAVVPQAARNISIPHPRLTEAQTYTPSHAVTTHIQRTPRMRKHSSRKRERGAEACSIRASSARS